MGHRTIPEPTANDFNVAFGAMLVSAQSFGLDVATDEPLLATFRRNAEVQAQMRAEIRWLYTMLHPGGEGIRGEWERANAPSPAQDAHQRWQDMADERHMSDLQDKLDAQRLMEADDDDD